MNEKSRRGRVGRRYAAPTRACLAMSISLALLVSGPLHAQQENKPDSDAAAVLDSLITRALTTSPRLRSAEARVTALRARIKPAGLWPDPMIMAGVQNMPIAEPGFKDEMTMKMIGVSQTIPLWGKLSLARDVATYDAAIGDAQERVTHFEIVRDVRLTYYELDYVHTALQIVERTRIVLIELIRAAEIRFATGTASQSASSSPAAMSSGGGASSSVGTATPALSSGSPAAQGGASGGMGQMSGSARPQSAGNAGLLAPPSASPAQESSMGGAPAGMSSGGSAMSSALNDMLRARVAAARLAEQASMLSEQQRELRARMNSFLTRESDAFVRVVGLPREIERSAVAAAATNVQFESAALGSRASGSPLPTLDSLQRIASREAPELAARRSASAAQSARVALSIRERRPDVQASFEYGQRDGGMPDMVTAIISVPLLLHRRDRQDQYVTEARAGLTAAEADHAEALNQISAEIARVHASAERSRTLLALYKVALLPQTQMRVDAALIGFQAGSTPLAAVLDARTEVFNMEIAYQRALTDFARAVAELEQIIGVEVIK